MQRDASMFIMVVGIAILVVGILVLGMGLGSYDGTRCSTQWGPSSYLAGSYPCSNGMNVILNGTFILMVGLAIGIYGMIRVTSDH